MMLPSKKSGNLRIKEEKIMEVEALTLGNWGGLSSPVGTNLANPRIKEEENFGGATLTC